MKINNGKDFWAGLMFIGFGLGFLGVAMSSYAMGTAVRMGPAYFPTVLGGMLAVLGAIIFLRSFLSKIHHPLKVFPFRGKALLGCLAVGFIGYLGQVGLDAGGMKIGPWFKEIGTIGTILYMGTSAASLALFFYSFGPRPLFIILMAVAIFGYLLKPLGLVISTFILIFWAAWGGNEFKFKEVAILAVALAVFGCVVFVWGLGLPIPYWPQLS